MRRLGRIALALVITLSVAVLPAGPAYTTTNASDVIASAGMTRCSDHHGQPGSHTSKVVAVCTAMAGCTVDGRVDCGIVGLSSIDTRADDHTTVKIVPAPGLAGIAYTANEKDGTISAIDVATGLVDSVAVPIMPHNVQISADGRWLYAVGMGMATTRTGGMGAYGMTEGRFVVLDSVNIARGTMAEITGRPWKPTDHVDVTNAKTGPPDKCIQGLMAHPGRTICCRKSVVLAFNLTD